MLNGYFRVNQFMQSTSHPNVFAGGDCVTIESHPDTPKAGIFAVKAGPFISQNIVNYIADKPLVPYVPKSGFLITFMTGDGKAIGEKFGICFIGKWVWELLVYFHKSYKDLFDPKNLFNDYENKGTSEPHKNFKLFEEDDNKRELMEMKQQAEEMDSRTAAGILSCDEEESDYHLRWQILIRMHFDKKFRDAVVQNYKPPYYE